MNSIGYPKMFESSSTKVVKGLDATKQNLKLLLSSERGDLFGDPDFGIRLKRYLYDQNNYILKDILIDELYNQIAVFMPQLLVDRKDIKIVQDEHNEKAVLYANIKAMNRLDFTTDMYNLVLFEEKE